MSVQVGGGDGDSPSPGPEFRHQVELALQVCRYLLEMFSVPLLCSHATVSLINHNHLQLYHANRSVILISSAINFSDGDGLDKFIATIIGFHCLSLEKNRILETMVPKNPRLVSKVRFRKNGQLVQKGNELSFSGDAEHEPFMVKLDDTISHDPVMVGRSTVVLNATSDEWPDNPLVVTGGEVSWKPVGTSWVNCRLWITFPPMYPPITFGAHLECNLNI